MKIARYILLIVLTALLLWGVFWARGKAQDTVCRTVTVVVENSDSTTLVTPQGIKADLEHQQFKFVGRPMWQINSNELERFLGNSPFLESASVVKGGDGELLICVRQLVPVMRVFDGNQSYYVNRHGKRMATSANYYADVPVVNGHFTRAYGPERLLPMIEYAEHDPTLRTIVDMYNFVNPDNIFMVPVFYGHVVNMGSVEGYQNKFQKLLLFYRKVMPVKGWNTYDTISLKWNHQVVATLRSQRSAEQVEYDPADDEQMPDLETMTGVAESKTMVQHTGQTATETQKAKEAQKQASQEPKKAAPEPKKATEEPKKAEVKNAKPKAKEKPKEKPKEKAKDKPKPSKAKAKKP